ncbi:isochorismatase family protein [Sphingomonas sp. HF-S3]|uniref:Isochorismatase family protein n=1 Tax=Sphingomonas rustica TaxID=3103142 RepID=A0ABV0B621_9SPHN
MSDPRDLDADYASAGFGGALVPGERPALLIIDLVMAYLDPHSHLYAGVEAELAANERLAAAARAAGIPVIFTNIEYRADGFDGGLFYRKVPALRAFAPGSPLGAFPPSLQPLESELVLGKKFPSAFFGTPLAAILTAARIDTLFITGYSTSGCVRATALDALCHGFLPFVVRDACGDRDPEVNEANLFDIQAKVAQVIDEAEALAAISAGGQRAA